VQDRGCDISVLWFSFLLVLCCLHGGWHIREVRFVLGKAAFILSGSVLESQTGKTQDRSLQGGVFTVESSVHSWQWSCWSQLCSYRVGISNVKAVSAAESAYLLLVVVGQELRSDQAQCLFSVK